MKVLGVHIEDFLSVGKADFTLDDRGLVLLQGENQDNPSASSNGSGKSSITDAICWALYGETARGVSAGQVVRNGAKRASVCLTFKSDTGEEYTVKRERTKTKSALVLTCDASGGTHAPTDLTLGTEKLTQERIEKILGASYEVFRAAVYIGQEQMPDLPAMTDKKLKELIEEAAGVGVIESAYALARTKLQEQERELLTASSKVSSLKANLDDYRNDLASTRAESANWVARHLSSILTIEANLDNAKKAHASAIGNPHLMAPANLAAAKARQAELDAQLKGLAAEQAREKALQAEVNRCDQAIASIAARVKMLADAAVKAKRMADAVTAQEGQPCTACGQTLTAGALTHACQSAREAAGESKREALQAGKALEAARGAHEQAEAALAAYRGGMSDPTAVMAEQRALADAFAAHRMAEREVDSLAREVAGYAAQIVSAKGEVNPFTKMISNKEAAIAATEEMIAEAEKAYGEALEEGETRAQVVKVFGPAGVRAHILDKVTPYLNDRTAAYLTTLSDGTLTATWTTLVKDAKGNLKEKFAIEVTHPQGEGFAGLSGGEKRKVRLACGMALQDLVASRATKPFRLWVMDECDEALDEAGLERLMMVLNEKAKEKGTVMVISHNALTDWIDQCWLVTKSGGASTLSGHE